MNKLLLALAIPTVTFAQTAAPVAPGINWLAIIQTQVDTLITNTSPTLLRFGWIEAYAAIVIGLVVIVIKWQMQTINLSHHVQFHLGDVFIFLMQTAGVEFMLQYYSTPMPGFRFSFHQMFPYMAQEITNAINMTMVDTVMQAIRDTVTNMQKPSITNFLGVVVYLSVLIDMALLELALFVINSASAVFIGLLSLFGPLMIPMFLTKHFNRMFWTWFESMLAFSMCRAVAAGITFVFANTFMTFFQQSVNGNYSIGNFTALFPVMIMLTATFLWAMFQVPSFTGRLCGGIGDMGQGLASAVQMAASGLAGA